MGSTGSRGSRGCALRRYRVLALPLLIVTFAGFGERQPAARVPVLAELFTSEGCNSCPPADRLLEHLLEAQPIAGVEIIALSEHVTYWDNQGWKDPFDSQQFTARQQRYGSRFNLDSIYTPQLIVDGRHEFVGSDQRSIEKALRAAATAPKPLMQIAVTAASDMLNVAASGRGTSQPGELWFALTEDHLAVDVKRGENANRRLTHSGVVRTLQSAGGTDISSKRVSFKIAPDWNRKNLRLVVFVQSRKDGAILSVASSEAGAP
jgi:hypothetical protein